MSFFKKLFSNKQESTEKVPTEVFTKDYFNERYTEENLKENPEVFEGNLRLLKGYFIDMKAEKPVDSSINHPKNLDETFEHVVTFRMYCNGFQLEDKMVAFVLSTAFSDFLINKYGFKLYRDKQPEYPLRFLTLKYNKNGVVLSLYPYEYATKVMNLQASFNDLENQIKDKLEVMPDYEKFIDDLTKEV